MFAAFYSGLLHLVALGLGPERMTLYGECNPKTRKWGLLLAWSAALTSSEV